MTNNKTCKVKLTAHNDTDETSDSDAAGIDQARAESIKTYLMSKGIDGARIIIESKGDTLPADTTATEIGQAKNRRVTFTFVP
ncbi:MAG: OmpA family protein [Crocinitomicaceae bacterium]|nr:OmpA family protein [Crocinitomicaceae bacterium]